MSGKVPPSSKARSRAIGRTDTQRAATRLKRFTGHDAEFAEKIVVPALPKTVACMGVCRGIIYETVRDGVAELYKHDFKDVDAPLVCVSPDGRQIVLVGGRYKWTERGIVDKTWKGK